MLMAAYFAIVLKFYCPGDRLIEMTKAPIIQAQKLTKIYSSGRIEVTAVKDVDLAVEKGTFIGVAGSSGSGKSTLMNLLGGLDSPTSGSIEFEGELISRMDKDELARYRRHDVGMIFQSFNLIPSFSAVENVSFPLLFAGVGKRERQERASMFLGRVGLSRREAHRPSELSGGEQQRVAIARALVNSPKILLADEPTGNLDSQTSREIVGLLAKINREQGLTVIMVSHEEVLLREHCDGIVRLFDGEVKVKEQLR
jgi:putative ABC transport system ATP-binding protein